MDQTRQGSLWSIRPDLGPDRREHFIVSKFVSSSKISTRVKIIIPTVGLPSGSKENCNTVLSKNNKWRKWSVKMCTLHCSQLQFEKESTLIKSGFLNPSRTKLAKKKDFFFQHPTWVKLPLPFVHQTFFLIYRKTFFLCLKFLWTATHNWCKSLMGIPLLLSMYFHSLHALVKVIQERIAARSNKRQVSSMIPSARHTIPPVANTILTSKLLCFARFWKVGIEDWRHVWK